MLKEEIINYSKKINIDLIGFCDSEISLELKDKLILQKTKKYNCEFQKGTIEEKINPKLLMKDCKTIIAIAISYPISCDKLTKLSKNEVYVSSSSWGKDYHKVLTELMQLLCDFIKLKNNDFIYKIICDTSVLCDRTIAYKAGLGFFGKNNLIINPKYGSNIFLGAILTNLELPYDQPIEGSFCENCNKCIEACPNNALTKEALLDANKCLSYISQKKDLNKIEESLINQCIYGCDICRRVCPYNNKNNTRQKDFMPTGIEFIDIDKYIPLSNKEFKKRYGDLAMAWRGASIINRNIKIYKDKQK